jgi:hypothetical protein
VSKRSSGQLNALERNLDAVDRRRVRQDGSNERKINRKGCRPSALRGSLPSELDQSVAGYVLKIHTAERRLECLKHHRLRSSYGFANLSKIIEMQRNQIGKDARLLMRPRASDWNASIY